MSTNTTASITTPAESDRSADVSYWLDERGRAYVGASESPPVPLSKLVAYAEHGEAALDSDHVHHALAANGGDGTPVHVNAPRFIVPLDADEHSELHRDDEWTEVDGIPLLLPDDNGEEGSDVDMRDHGHRDGNDHSHVDGWVGNEREVAADDQRAAAD